MHLSTAGDHFGLNHLDSYPCPMQTCSFLQLFHEVRKQEHRHNPDTSGYDGVLASLPHEIVVEKSKFAWDMDTNPGDLAQNDLQQWKDACGDDPNEYLIREHAAKEEGEYN